MPNITKRFVESLKPEENDQYYWDEKLCGFGVRVKPTGTVSYMVQYRNYNRSSRRMTLGKHANPLTTEKARDMARRILIEAKDGKDPARARKDAAVAPSLRDLFDRYIAEYAEQNKRMSSVTTDKHNIRHQVYTNINPSKKVVEITRQDVERMKLALKDKPNSFNRARAVLSKAMELAEVWEYRDQNTNPCRHVTAYKTDGRERFLSSEDFTRLGDALSIAEQNQTESPYAIAAIRLLIFLGARRGEILNLLWDEIDFENRIINLSTSKTGKKRIFINPPALEILNSLQKKADSPYVIPGKIPGKPLADLKGPWKRIRKASDLDDLRVHDLRHSYASVGAVGGVPLQIVSKLLGHSKVVTTERYSHLAPDPVRDAGDAIGVQIAAALNSRETSGTVVDFPKRNK